MRFYCWVYFSNVRVVPLVNRVRDYLISLNHSLWQLFSKDAKPVNIRKQVSMSNINSRNHITFSRARYSSHLGFSQQCLNICRERNFQSPNTILYFFFIISVCLPDGTVQVTNPNVGVYSHVFAVQDEGVSAAVKCTVSTTGAQSNITGCSQVCKIQNNNHFYHRKPIMEASRPGGGGGGGYSDVFIHT